MFEEQGSSVISSEEQHDKKLVTVLSFSGIESYLKQNAARPGMFYAVYITKENEAHIEEKHKQKDDVKNRIETAYEVVQSTDEMYNQVSLKDINEKYDNCHFKFHINLVKSSDIEKAWDTISPIIFSKDSPVTAIKYLRYGSAECRTLEEDLIDTYGKDYHNILTGRSNNELSQADDVLYIDSKGHLRKQVNTNDEDKNDDRLLNSVQITFYLWKLKDKEVDYIAYQKLCADIEEKLKAEKIEPGSCPTSDFKMNSFISLRGSIDSKGNDLKKPGYFVKKSDYLDHPIVKQFITGPQKQIDSNKIITSEDEDLGDILDVLMRTVADTKQAKTYWARLSNSMWSSMPKSVLNIKTILSENSNSAEDKIIKIINEVKNAYQRGTSTIQTIHDESKDISKTSVYNKPSRRAEETESFYSWVSTLFNTHASYQRRLDAFAALKALADKLSPNPDKEQKNELCYKKS